MYNLYSPIEDLLIAPEGAGAGVIQFKEAKRRFEYDEAVRICCALSNCGGGLLVLGISDKRPREVVGSEAFPQPERTRESLMKQLKIQVDFFLHENEGKRVLVFEAARRPVGLPIQANGIPWWYEGDSLIPMPEEKRREIYAESGHDFSNDICQDAKISDLDQDALNAFRDQWFEKSGQSRIRAASHDQLLRDAGALTDDGVTYAALILFGTERALARYLPQAEIIFEYRSGEASGPAQQRDEFRVGFFACYDRLWNLVNLRNELQHYQEGFFIRDIPTFNERVVREAVLNAVSHRNYQLAGSIFIRQYPDRLAVESPGGLPVGVTFDNILDRQSPRNRRIAEILALCGLVERSGQGMNLIYEESIKEAKAPPEFTGSDDCFLRIILHGMVLDKGLLSLINRISSEHMSQMHTDDWLIINQLFHGKRLLDTLKPRLPRLTEMGILENAGRGRYNLARRLYVAAGKPGTHTRRTGLDRETNKELILKHLRGCGKAGAPLRELQEVLPHYSAPQLQVLLRELRRDGRVFSEGRTRGARWIICSGEAEAGKAITTI